MPPHRTIQEERWHEMTTGSSIVLSLEAGSSAGRWIQSAARTFMVILAVMVIASPMVSETGGLGSSELLRRRKLPPSTTHLMGTDGLGRDMLSRTVKGAGITLAAGILARTGALLLGTLLGVAAGWFGGRTDTLIMRTVDSFLAFPGMLLAIGISLALGQGLTTVIISLALTGWAEIARIIRGCVLEIRHKDYVTSGKACGGDNLHLIRFHVIPNLVPTLSVVWAMGISASIMGEAALSFLGIGVGPSTPSWGAMVREGFESLSSAPWIALIPGAMISATVISMNVMADRINDRLNPFIRRRKG
jgi:peptide/nickel transport system permease protein